MGRGRFSSCFGWGLEGCIQLRQRHPEPYIQDSVFSFRLPKLGLSNVQHHQLTSLRTQLDWILLSKDMNWRQHSRERWAKNGKAHTKYFHQIAKVNAFRIQPDLLLTDNQSIFHTN